MPSGQERGKQPIRPLSLSLSLSRLPISTLFRVRMPNGVGKADSADSANFTAAALAPVDTIRVRPHSVTERESGAHAE